MNKLLDSIENNFGKHKAKEQCLFIESPAWARLTHISYLPAGQCIEIQGAAGIGKTSFILHLLYSLKKLVPILYIDAEYSLYNASDNILIARTNNTEHIKQIIQIFVESDSGGIIVIDSLAALAINTIPELDDFVKEILSMIKDTSYCVIFANQTRVNIKRRKLQSFGSNLFKSLCTIRIQITKHINNIYSYEVITKTLKNVYGSLCKDINFNIRKDI